MLANSIYLKAKSDFGDRKFTENFHTTSDKIKTTTLFSKAIFELQNDLSGGDNTKHTSIKPPFVLK